MTLINCFYRLQPQSNIKKMGTLLSRASKNLRKTCFKYSKSGFGRAWADSLIRIVRSECDTARFSSEKNFECVLASDAGYAGVGLKLTSVSIRFVGDEISLALRGEWISDVMMEGIPLEIRESFFTSSFNVYLH